MAQCVYNRLPLHGRAVIGMFISLLFFSGSVAELFIRWFAVSSQYAHGIFVFGAFFWLLFRKIQEFPPERITASVPSGIAVIMLSVFLNLYGEFREISTARCLAVYFFIIGNCILFLGAGFARRNIMLFFYLFLAVPLPAFVTDTAMFHLKIFATRVSEIILSIFYHSVSREGALLLIEGYEIEITPACSGLQNIFAMLSLLLFLGLIQTKRRTALLDYLAAVPAAIAANVIRIITVCALTAGGYGQFALVTYHEVIGVIAFLIIFTIIAACNDFPLWKTHTPFRILNDTHRAILPRYTLLMAVLVVVSVAVIILNTSAQRMEHPRVKSTISKEIAGWTSRDFPLEESYYRLLETDDLLMREFTKHDSAEDDTSVYLYLVHSRNKRSAFMHRPELCLQGEGYNLVEKSEIRLLNDSVRAYRMLFSGNGKCLLVYYWYHINGRNFNRYIDLQMMYLGANQLDFSGSMIRLSRIVNRDNVPAGEAVLRRFVDDAVPAILKHL